MQSKFQSGFTVIELMITLAVAAILAMIAAPSFTGMIEKSRLRGATDDLVNLLNTSRANAVKTERQVNVSVSGTTSWCAGAVAESGPATPGLAATPAYNAPCNCNASTVSCLVAGQNALVSSSDYSGVTLSSVTGIAYVSTSSGGVTFDPKFGAVTDSSGSLLATSPQIVVLSKSGKYSTRITVSPLGQTSVCIPSTSQFVAWYPSC
jgi:prepilin-type N-terminal cleavage/methylation domain-containing protein